jgi:hypothetical protein
MADYQAHDKQATSYIFCTRIKHVKWQQYLKQMFPEQSMVILIRQNNLP